MLKNNNSVDTAPKSSSGDLVTKNIGTLRSMGFLTSWLDTRTMLALSQTCKIARDVSADDRKKHALKNLLDAVVRGNEALVRKIVMSRPELLLDSSGIVKDISGKVIENLTPLQAAICAGDVDMVEMIKQVLQEMLERGVKLSFNPLDEIKRQIQTVYPYGTGPVLKDQIDKGNEFANSNLKDIFNAIMAASEEQVQIELDNPGLIKEDSQLSVDLHKFREQFTERSNKEHIFNPIYLLKAFELHQTTGVNNNPQKNITLFWNQVVGFIQRHLPACYLQAFAQGINNATNGQKLERDFKFKYNADLNIVMDFYILNGLGYKWAVAFMAYPEEEGRLYGSRKSYNTLHETKKSYLCSLCPERVTYNNSNVISRPSM